jgi:Na+/serine symporter
MLGLIVVAYRSKHTDGLTSEVSSVMVLYLTQLRSVSGRALVCAYLHPDVVKLGSTRNS